MNYVCDNKYHGIKSVCRAMQWKIKPHRKFTGHDLRLKQSKDDHKQNWKPTITKMTVEAPHGLKKYGTTEEDIGDWGHVASSHIIQQKAQD